MKRLTKDEAKKIPILDVAKNLGMDLMRTGSREYAWKVHDSLKLDIRKNNWRRYSTGAGGDTIALVQYIKGITYKQAMDFLSTGDFEATYTPIEKADTFSYTLAPYEKPFVSAKDYLKTTRGLSEDTIAFFYNQGVLAQAVKKAKDGYKEDVLVFKFYDRTKTLVGASLQGIIPNKDRYEAKGYLKQILFASQGISGLHVDIGTPKRLVFTEAPIDLMSYYELHKDQLQNVRLVSMEGLKEGVVSRYSKELLQELALIKEDYLDLTQTKNIDLTARFLETTAKTTNFFKEEAPKDLITLAVDNDEAGRDFIAKFQEKAIPVQVELPPLEEGKDKMDWNDLLKERKSTIMEESYQTKRAKEAMIKAQAKVNNLIQSAFDHQRQTNGQPMNDKRGASAFFKRSRQIESQIASAQAELEKRIERLERLENQDRLKSLGFNRQGTGLEMSVKNIPLIRQEIEKAERGESYFTKVTINRYKKALARLEEINEMTNNITLSKGAMALIESERLTQWKKQPNIYFIKGQRFLALTLGEDGRFRQNTGRYAPKTPEEKALVKEFLDEQNTIDAKIQEKLETPAPSPKEVMVVFEFSESHSIASQFKKGEEIPYRDFVALLYQVNEAEQNKYGYFKTYFDLKNDQGEGLLKGIRYDAGSERWLLSEKYDGEIPDEYLNIMKELDLQVNDLSKTAPTPKREALEDDVEIVWDKKKTVVYDFKPPQEKEPEKTEYLGTISRDELPSNIQDSEEVQQLLGELETLAQEAYFWTGEEDLNLSPIEASQVDHWFSSGQVDKSYNSAIFELTTGDTTYMIEFKDNNLSLQNMEDMATYISNEIADKGVDKTIEELKTYIADLEQVKDHITKGMEQEQAKVKGLTTEAFTSVLDAVYNVGEIMDKGAIPAEFKPAWELYFDLAEKHQKNLSNVIVEAKERGLVDLDSDFYKEWSQDKVYHEAYHVRLYMMEEWDNGIDLPFKEGQLIDYKTFVTALYKANHDLHDRRQETNSQLTNQDDATKYIPYTKTGFEIYAPEGELLVERLRYDVGDETIPITDIIKLPDQKHYEALIAIDNECFNLSQDQSLDKNEEKEVPAPTPPLNQNVMDMTDLLDSIYNLGVDYFIKERARYHSTELKERLDLFFERYNEAGKDLDKTIESFVKEGAVKQDSGFYEDWIEDQKTVQRGAPAPTKEVPKPDKTISEMLDSKDLEGLSKQLKEGIIAFQNSDKYREFLLAMSKFHSYSFRNIQLLVAQNQDVSLVASFNKWKKDFDRHVIKGQKSLKVWAPMQVPKRDKTGKPVLDERGEPVLQTIFKLVPVFDVSQTEGKPIPKVTKNLEGIPNGYALLYKSLKEISNNNNVDMSFSPNTGQANGYYNPSKNAIVIKTGMSEAQTLKTIIHEMAHSELHNNEVMANKTIQRNEAELQAESVAFVVCAYYGFDTSDYSMPYLNSWLADKVELTDLEKQLDTVQKEAKSLIDRIDKCLEKYQVKEETLSKFDQKIREAEQLQSQKLEGVSDEKKQEVNHNQNYK